MREMHFLPKPQVLDLPQKPVFLIDFEKNVPYESLNCDMVPIADPLVRTANMEDILFSDEDSLAALRPIQQLEAEKNVRSLESVIKDIDSLNIEWEEQGQPHSLANVYTMDVMSVFNVVGIDPNSKIPSLFCIRKNMYVARMMDFTREAMARLILERPEEANSILDTLSPLQRRQLIRESVKEAIYSGRQEIGPLETLYESIPNDEQEVLISAIDYRYSTYQLSLTGALPSNATGDPAFDLSVYESALASSVDPAIQDRLSVIVSKMKESMEPHVWGSDDENTDP
jgi:hypothetical protein